MRISASSSCIDLIPAGLKCHLCGSDLSLTYQPAFRYDPEYAVAACKCREYPVINGILLYKAHPRAKQAIDIIRNARNNDELQASVSLLIGEQFVRGLLRLTMLMKKIFPKWKGFSLWMLSSFIVDSRWATYVKYRFSAPSLISGMALIPVVKKAASKGGPVLDFGCGFGHLSYLIARQIGAENITCADRDFINLFFARNYLPGASSSFICLDGNEPLPFKDGAFSAVVSMDCFHYVEKKELLAGELMRSLKNNGAMVFIHSHNINKPNISRGMALTPEGYAELFKPFGVKMVPEEALLAAVFNGKGADLGADVPAGEVSSAADLSFVASADRGYFGAYESYFELKGGIDGEKFILNPLYRKRADKYVRVFPSDFYEEEYAKIKNYLPEDVDPKLPEEELKRKLILIPVPDNYKRENEQTSIHLWR